MNIQDQLLAIGLTNSEIKTYLYLLSQGLSSPPTISKGLNIARPNLYFILNQLKEKNLISTQLNKKRKLYSANDPITFIQTLERKKIEMQKILPDLRGMYQAQKNKPKILFFQGKEEIKHIFDIAAEAKNELLGIASTNKLQALDPVWYKTIGPKLFKRNIVFRDILTAESAENSAKISKGLMKGLYDARFIDKKFGDLPTDILIWNNCIAIMTLNEPVFGTILEDQNLTASFRVIFEVMWDALKNSDS